jgi:hypothetical protein
LITNYQKNGFIHFINCALSILSRIGIESRSQKYTAILLEYLELKKLIVYNPDFIRRIKVYSKKGEESEVDKREFARYSSAIKIEQVKERYHRMMELCKEAISQAEEILYSKDKIEIPKEFSK